MFVGVGAARVRDLFEEARKRAPAIIFVDEIDAIGQRRGAGGAIVSNDEREQTLNQSLAEMDGFDPLQGIVVLAATNRPEILDPALLRPGRFDRQVTIPLPNQLERRGHPRAALPGQEARCRPSTWTRWPGARRGSAGPTSPTSSTRRPSSPPGRAVRSSPPRDFDEARDRIILGRQRGPNVLLPDERRAVAVHEGGHALVAALCEHADPVAKVTILPAGQALGVTHQLPLDERHLYRDSYLHDSLAGGLAGERPSSSCSARGPPARPTTSPRPPTSRNEWSRSTGCRPSSGPSGTPPGDRCSSATAPRSSTAATPRQTQHLIDREAARLLREAEERARKLLAEHRDKLDQLADLLLATRDRRRRGRVRARRKAQARRASAGLDGITGRIGRHPCAGGAAPSSTSTVCSSPSRSSVSSTRSPGSCVRNAASRSPGPLTSSSSIAMMTSLARIPETSAGRPAPPRRRAHRRRRRSRTARRAGA